MVSCLVVVCCGYNNNGELFSSVMYDDNGCLFGGGMLRI